MSRMQLEWVLRVARHGMQVPNGHHATLEAIAKLAILRLRSAV